MLYVLCDRVCSLFTLRFLDVVEFLGVKKPIILAGGMQPFSEDLKYKAV